MYRWLATLCILAALLCAPRAARAQDAAADYEAGRKTAQAELVKRLEGLADWCNSKELFLERDHVWQSILVLDTSNVAARKGLRYARNPDGSWQEPAAREVKNRNPKALEELPAKRAAATEPFRNALMALLEKEPENSPLRRSAYNEILAIDPDDGVVHALLGEKELDGKWVLLETWQAKQRRGEIKALAKGALASATKIEKLEPNSQESDLGVHWSNCFKIDSVRVLSTGDEAEARRTAELVYAAGPFFRGILACDTQHQENWTSYLLVHPGEQDTFLDHQPSLTTEYRAFLKNVVGCGLPAQPKVVYWDKEASHRTDGCARQTINDLMGRTFGITMNQGWAWEGCGLYLNRELTGTRFTWFIQPTGGKYNSMRARLMSPTSNWMNEAVTLLGSNEHPKFAAMLEKDVNSMGVEDMLYAYAFAAYLIEGRPKDTPEVLHQIGQIKQPTAKAIENVLHMEPDAVEERLYRWLTERK